MAQYIVSINIKAIIDTIYLMHYCTKLNIKLIQFSFKLKTYSFHQKRGSILKDKLGSGMSQNSQLDKFVNRS